jgi:hypothetical protein
MATQLFGLGVDEINTDILEQMLETAKGKGASSFVSNEDTRYISEVDTDEFFYVRALEVVTHKGSEISPVVSAELDRRAKGKAIIARLLCKIYGAPTDEQIAEAWAKAEAKRRSAVPRVVQPREVPPRIQLRVATS